MVLQELDTYVEWVGLRRRRDRKQDDEQSHLDGSLDMPSGE
jgi:hypothetical protein